MCQATLLSSKGTSSVSYCPKCKNHYINHVSYLLCFTNFQYDLFYKEIKNKIGNEEFLTFPNDQKKIILTSPVEEILFTFTEVEWSNFTFVLDEAYYMREVYNIIL